MCRRTVPSELVLSDTYYPGWNVTVNGQPAGIDEVDYLLRGVHVPAGDDRMVFSYDPGSFTAGWTVSLGATAARDRGARRRPSQAPRTRSRPPRMSGHAFGHRVRWPAPPQVLVGAAGEVPERDREHL